MRDALPAFLRHLTSKSRASRTIETYEAVITALIGFLTATNVSTFPPSRTAIEEFLARPRRDGERRSPATRNQELAALRVFFAFAVQDLGWTTNPTERIPFVREPPHDPAVLTAQELRKMFTTAAEIARPRERSRDLAILALLSQTGLRVHELVGLDVPQVDLTTATLLAVKGKGATIHDLPLNVPAIALVSAWLAERPAFSAPEETALIVSSRGTRMAIRTVDRLFERLRKAMGTAKKITPHSLRHTVATLALTSGTDLATVADLLRHADLNTTRRYLHLVDTRRREAVARLAGTVPLELLPQALPANEMAPRTDREALPETVQPLVPPRPNPLDHQYGLDASSPPERPPPIEATTNTTRTPMKGACVVSQVHSGEARAFPRRGGAAQATEQAAPKMPSPREATMFHRCLRALASLFAIMACSGTPEAPSPDASNDANLQAGRIREEPGEPRARRQYSRPQSHHALPT